MFAKAEVRDQRLPFQVTASPCALTKDELKRRIDSLESGKGTFCEIAEAD
jgi:hypothetical protein